MTTELPYQLERRGAAMVLELCPGLNDVQWADIEQIGSEVIAAIEPQTRPKLLVDLSKLNYMGSSQVALVVRVWKAVQQHNGKMVVACSHPMVREVLDLSGLSKVWTISPTTEEGLKLLGVSASAKPQPSSSEAPAADSSGRGVLGGAALATVLALLAGGLHVARLMPDWTLWGLLGFSTIGFLLGLGALVGVASARSRLIAVGMTVISVGLLVVGVMLATGTPLPGLALPEQVEPSIDIEGVLGEADEAPAAVDTDDADDAEDADDEPAEENEPGADPAAVERPGETEDVFAEPTEGAEATQSRENQ